MTFGAGKSLMMMWGQARKVCEVTAEEQKEKPWGCFQFGAEWCAQLCPSPPLRTGREELSLPVWAWFGVLGTGTHLGKLLPLTPALHAMLSPGNYFITQYFCRRCSGVDCFKALWFSRCVWGTWTISPPLSSPSYLLLFRGDTNLAPSVPFPTDSSES